MDTSKTKDKNTRKSSNRVADLSLSEIGRVPPQSVDFEEAVLGAMLLEKDAVTDSIGILQPQSFYKEAHQKIFTAIHQLFESSEPIDILTVTNQLRKTGELDFIGGPFYLTQLTNRVASSAHVEYHARIIAEKFILREIIRISSETIKTAYDDSSDVFDILNKAESELFSVTQSNLRKSYDSMSNIMKQALDQIAKAQENDDDISGVPSGFKELDKMTSGWQRSDMIVLAARPGMGKTAFVLSMARNTAVDFNMGVAVFSLEMSSVQLVNRLISSETGISSEKLRKGKLSDAELQQLHTRIRKLSTAPLYIDDTPGLSIFELRAKCRQLKTKYDIQLVVIDYLQLMSAGSSKGGGNREQEISQISRSIKEIAKELNIPIIALSQLSRSVETRGGDKKPILSDLRESGAIEQDADIVSFIYRAEYYGLEPEGGGQNIGEIILAKHRNGSLGTVQLKFVGHLAKFANLDDDFDGMNDFNAIGPNVEFDDESGGATMTRQSRMNDTEYEDEDFNEEVDKENPF